MNTYTVTVTREDNLWVAVTEGLPEGVVGAMDFDHFAEVHEGMRGLIADLTDTDPNEFHLVWRYEFAGDATKLVQEYLDAAEEAELVRHRRDAAREELVRQLSGPLSQRAVGDLVGLSHQRVHQLVTS